MRLGALAIERPRFVRRGIGDALNPRRQQLILLVQQAVVRLSLDVIAGEDQQTVALAYKRGESFEKLR